MTFLVLPLQGDADKFTVRTDLLGEEFRFDFLWNERDEHWYFSLFTSTDEPILQGQRVTIGNFVLKNVLFVNRPKGFLIAIDKEGTETDPGRNDLGNRVELVFTDLL